MKQRTAYPFRPTLDMLKALQESAIAAKRSTNAEINHRLQQTFAEDFTPATQPRTRASLTAAEHEVCMAAAHAAAASTSTVCQAIPHLSVGNRIAGAYLDAKKKMLEGRS